MRWRRQPLVKSNLLSTVPVVKWYQPKTWYQAQVNSQRIYSRVDIRFNCLHQNSFWILMTYHIYYIYMLKHWWTWTPLLVVTICLTNKFTHSQTWLAGKSLKTPMHSRDFRAMFDNTGGNLIIYGYLNSPLPSWDFIEMGMGQFTLYPFCSHQNSSDLWMLIPKKRRNL